MKNIISVIKKELKHYFYSPLAYVIFSVFLFVTSWFFSATLQQYINVSLNPVTPYGQEIKVNLFQDLFNYHIQSVTVILLFLMPLITMKSMAEERRSGTFELLATSPLKNYELILGKYFALLIVFMIMMILSSTYFISIYIIQPFSIVTALVLNLGLFLAGSTFIAIGFLCSSLYKNPIFAGVTTFGFLLVMWLISGIFGEIGKELSVVSHIISFTRGVLSLKDVLYYIFMIIFTLFVSSLYIDSIRWRE